MTLLAEPEVAASVSAHGGDRLLAALTAMHDAFGKACGSTAAMATPEAAIDARPQFLAGKDARRDCVKKVEGIADADVVEGYRKAPETRVAEVIGGELSPRPRPRDIHGVSVLSHRLGPFFDPSDGDPGGWVIHVEPEPHLGPRPDIVVADRGALRRLSRRVPFSRRG